MCHNHYCVYWPADKSETPEFITKLNEILLSTSQSEHVFIECDRNIELLDQIAKENSCTSTILKLEVECYPNNHVQINKDVSFDKNNL